MVMSSVTAASEVIPAASNEALASARVPVSSAWTIAAVPGAGGFDAATGTGDAHEACEGTRGGITADTGRWCAGKPDDARGNPLVKSSRSMSVTKGGRLVPDAYGADVVEDEPLLTLASA